MSVYLMVDVGSDWRCISVAANRPVVGNAVIEVLALA
jgi:hypothetical protein